jgi:hypothetical protein
MEHVRFYLSPCADNFCCSEVGQEIYLKLSCETYVPTLRNIAVCILPVLS